MTAVDMASPPAGLPARGRHARIASAPRHARPRNPMVTGYVTFDPEMLQMGKAAAARIEAGRGTDTDREIVKEALLELTTSLTICEEDHA